MHIRVYASKKLHQFSIHVGKLLEVEGGARAAGCDNIGCVSQGWQSSINGGHTPVGRVASPTLQRHPWRSRLASLHACSLSILSDSQQEASTCRSQEFCGRPLGLLQVVLSLTETTR